MHGLKKMMLKQAEREKMRQGWINETGCKIEIVKEISGNMLNGKPHTKIKSYNEDADTPCEVDFFFL